MRFRSPTQGPGWKGVSGAVDEAGLVGVDLPLVADEGVCGAHDGPGVVAVDRDRLRVVNKAINSVINTSWIHMMVTVANNRSCCYLLNGLDVNNKTDAVVIVHN